MTTFDGLVTLEDQEVQVEIGLGPDRVTLKAGNIEIGEWAATDCVITDRGDGTWVIEAEEETLPFLPEEPDRFAAEVNGADAGATTEETNAAESTFEVVDAPPPRLLTRVGFYALAALTLALGVWAAVSLFG